MKKEASFIISHSYGECEFVFPIIFENYNNFKNINVIFMSPDNRDKYLKDSIFKKITKLSKVNILCPENKFKKLITFLKISFNSKYIFHSEDMINNQNIIINFLSKIFIKKRILFKHTSSPWFKRYKVENIEYSRNFNRDKKKPIILYDNGSIKHFLRMEFRKIVKVNDYNLSKKIENFIKSDFSYYKQQKYILILSYRSHPKIFSKNKRLQAYKNVLEIIKKKYPNHFIYIKPHPSEDLNDVKDILMRFGSKNTFITEENTTLLTKYAETTLALCTFGGYRAFAQKKKSAIYYEHLKDWFGINETYYNTYDPQNGGIKILRNKEQLKKFLEEPVIEYKCNYKYIDLKETYLID